MPEVVPSSRQEFWLRPPTVTTPAPLPANHVIVNSCAKCGTEFMTGSHFCYVCGTKRGFLVGEKAVNWVAHLGLLRVSGFQSIRQSLGLSTLSLLSFLAGVGCLIVAISAGTIFSVRSFAGFPGIELARIEWLLGAIAAFLAGILVKQSASSK